MLLTAGERISMALLCMAIIDLGEPAVSFTGSQAGIVTDTDARQGQDPRGPGRPDPRGARRRARSRSSPASRACRPTRDITTLGRGGSDTTAVALAAALGADVCEIYTDVAGVYTADPRIVPDARASSRGVSFDEMLEMAATGGRVLALRSVEFARNHGVPRPRAFELHVGAGHLGHRGGGRDESMEQAIISGVTHDTSEAKVTIEQVPDRPGVAATVFRALADAGVNVDMIVQNVSTAGHTDISFTVPARRPRARAATCMEKIVVETEASGCRTDDAHRPGLARRRGHEDATPASRRKMFETLADRGRQHRDDHHVDDPDLVRGRTKHDVERAVRALHAAFELDEGQ